MIYCHYLLVKLGYETLTLFPAPLCCLGVNQIKNKNKNNLKRIKQCCSVESVLTRCRCNRSLSTVFPLQVAFRNTLNCCPGGPACLV